MNRFGRRTRRADEWASPHERARRRAAQRLDWPLDPDEVVWLESHLTQCKPCRRRAAEYQENRDRLRTLRDVTPPVSSSLVPVQELTELGMVRTPQAVVDR